jgi:hypothetical protein
MDDKRHSVSESESSGPPTARGAPNGIQHPGEWLTGDVPMSAAQASLLLTLCEEAGEPFDGGLSKADASLRIEALQKKADGGHPEPISEEAPIDG